MNCNLQLNYDVTILQLLFSHISDKFLVGNILFLCDLTLLVLSTLD